MDAHLYIFFEDCVTFCFMYSQCNGGYIFTIAMHCYQIYDTGVIEGSTGLFKVSNVQIFGGYIVHIGSFHDNAGSRFHVGDRVVCKVSFLMCCII